MDSSFVGRGVDLSNTDLSKYESFVVHVYQGNMSRGFERGEELVDWLRSIGRNKDVRLIRATSKKTGERTTIYQNR